MCETCMQVQPARMPGIFDAVGCVNSSETRIPICERGLKFGINKLLSVVFRPISAEDSQHQGGSQIH